MADTTITIIDCGTGNLRSVLRRIEKLGYQAQISSDAKDIEAAEKLILPGVGAFNTGMNNLQELGLVPVLNQKVLEDKTPILGICLGMQFMTRGSEEGDTEGLGWIDAQANRFQFNEEDSTLKVPHMGWNVIQKKNSPDFLNAIPDQSRFYFVHSYFVEAYDPDVILATTHYGTEFTSIIQKDNIFATQFHPEKSHQPGVQLLKNFLGMQS